MSNIKTTFLGKEYSIPADVVTYVDLVDFTNEIRDTLITSFKRQIWPKIDVIESNNFMIATINDQVAKFIRKLLENDIYDRTANDYLQGNKGYELFLDTKRKVIRQIISIRQEKLDTYRAGVEGAKYRKEASVTGLDFGIISSSFVNHMIYAYMDASKQTQQEQEALKTYNREIAELDKQAAEYDRQENAYIADNVIPAINTVFTFFAYELLDQYVSDLIKAGKFDKAALNFINLERSNDLLENINLAGNKRAVIESAFMACPFNMAVYMHAMKQEILDEDSFETANTFKQGSKIISFLKESLGAADYPNFAEPNYYSASLLARYTNKSTNDVLYQHTSSYANAVIREYEKIVKALDSPNQCRDYLRKLNDDEVLSGEGTSKRLAKSLVYSIITNDNWNILVKQCGHSDLLGKLLAIMPVGSTFGSKVDCDSNLAEGLFNALEIARKDLAQKILDSRAHAEAERQKLEAQKRKKRIKTTAILCAIVAVIVVAISLPSIIENAKTAKRESYVEEQIQAVIVPLEREMEDATGVDIIIDYYFSLENDWDDEQWYEWTFSVELPIFEEYRKSNSASEQALLEVMDVCKTLVEIYDDVYDDLDFDFKKEDVRIVMDFSGGNFGSLKIHDTSTTETFYYEEYGGERYLHSFDTEYVIDADLQTEDSMESAGDYNGKELSDEEKIEYASKILGRRCDESGNISLNADLGNFINGSNPLFGEDGHFELGAYAKDSKGLKIDTLDWLSNGKVKDFSKIVSALKLLYGEPADSNIFGTKYEWTNIGVYSSILCERNADKSVKIRWIYRISNPEDQVLDGTMQTDLEKLLEYASCINGAAENVLKDYPHFEDDGDTYYQNMDSLFEIEGYYKFEYFKGNITAVRFTWIPTDWRNDEEYVVECLKKCFGDFTGYSELLDDEWFCYTWEDTTADNLKVSYYIAEDEGEILIRAK